VWFGIEDKNPTVDHAGIDHLMEHGVEVHQFSPEFHKEIEDVNKEFMKWANMKNEEAKKEKKKSSDHLNERAAATNLDSLSDEAFKKFLTESKSKFKPKSAEFLQERTIGPATRSSSIAWTSPARWRRSRRDRSSSIHDAARGIWRRSRPQSQPGASRSSGWGAAMSSARRWGSRMAGPTTATTAT
jgi:hypothetical protein